MKESYSRLFIGLASRRTHAAKNGRSCEDCNESGETEQLAMTLDKRMTRRRLPEVWVEQGGYIVVGYLFEGTYEVLERGLRCRGGRT